MGTCFTKPDINRYIDNSLSYDKTNVWKIHRLAVVGTKSSGKTTLINQLHCIYNKGIKDNKTDDNIYDFISFKTKKQTIKDIRQNCINNIICLCDDEKSIASLEQLSININYNLQTLSNIISTIWNKEAIKAKYSLRHFYCDEYVLDENMDHFLNKIDTIMAVDYCPTINDVISHRSSNKSFKDTLVTIRGHIFQFTDIGSVSSELYRKQLHWFEQLNVIIFVAALSDYACTSSVYSVETDMIESIYLFDMIVNNRYMRHVDIVLLLNKNDIFKDCLKKGISLNTSFPDWDGAEYINTKLPLIAWYMSRHIEIKLQKVIPKDVTDVIARYIKPERIVDFDTFYSEAVQFITMKYKQVARGRNKQIYVHPDVMGATDTCITNRVLDDIQHWTVVNKLRCGGIM